MRATVVVCRNVLAPGSAELRQLRRRARVRALAPRGRRPLIALLNGRPSPARSSA